MDTILRFFYSASLSDDHRFLGYVNLDNPDSDNTVYADAANNTDGISVIVMAEPDCMVTINGQHNQNITDCDCISIKRSECLPESASSIINHKYFYDPEGMPIGLLDVPGNGNEIGIKDIPLKFLAETNSSGFKVGALSEFSRSGVVFVIALDNNDGSFRGYFPQGDDPTISGVMSPAQYLSDLRTKGSQSPDEAIYVDIRRDGDVCSVETRATESADPIAVPEQLTICDCYDAPGDYQSDNLLGIVANCIPFEAQTKDLNSSDGIDLPFGVQNHKHFYDMTGVPITLMVL